MVYMCTPLELDVLKMLTKFGHDRDCVYCCLEELANWKLSASISENQQPVSVHGIGGRAR